MNNATRKSVPSCIRPMGPPCGSWHNGAAAPGKRYERVAGRELAERLECRMEALAKNPDSNVLPEMIDIIFAAHVNRVPRETMVRLRRCICKHSLLSGAAAAMVRGGSSAASMAAGEAKWRRTIRRLVLRERRREKDRAQRVEVAMTLVGMSAGPATN